MVYSLNLAIRKKEWKEKMFHIDELSIVGSAPAGHAYEVIKQQPASADPITSIVMSENILIVGRQSGSILQLTIPTLSLNNRFNAPISPFVMKLNNKSTRLAISDINGQFRIMQLEEKITSVTKPKDEQEIVPGSMLDIERKDVWDFKWARDNSETIAVLEKNKLFVIQNTDAEDAVPCTGCNQD